MAKENNSKTKQTKKVEKNKRHFFKDFKAELKRVVWPTPKQLTNSTIAVITIVVVIGIIVFALDLGFKFLNTQNTKLQESLQTKFSNEEETETEDTDTTSEETTDEASSEVSIETDTTEESAE